MNGLIASFANHTVTISTPATGQDSSGFSIPSYSSSATNVPCRIHELTGGEAVRYGRPLGTRVFIGSFEPGTVIRAEDRVAWAGVSLQVKAVRQVLFTDSAGTVSHVEADLEVQDQ